MAITYNAIVSVSLTASQASVNLGSIPSNYTDLVLVVTGKTTSADQLLCRINNDTGSNYSRTTLGANGSITQSTRAANDSRGVTGTYGYFETTVGYINTLFINNYSNTTSYKQILSRSGNGANGVSAVANLWRSTSAVNTINLYTDSGYSFDVGTTFNLYGILAA
jgi:hypothetical protein